jgi:hypothetical protein
MQSGLFNDKGWDRPMSCSGLTVSKGRNFDGKTITKGQKQEYSNFFET